MSADPSRVGALRFEPWLEERVWGGRRLAGLGRRLPSDVPIGEAWEISAIEGRSSRVLDGPHAGADLHELLGTHSGAILGDTPRGAAPFPLLLKLLDSSEPLSIQLHPSDEEAVRLEGPGPGSVGKTEAWIVLDAEPGAEIVHGLAPGTEPAELYDRLDRLQGEPLPRELERTLFRWRPVAAGDVIHIPAGTIHALGAGVLLMEVQQSSDITYRIYDWGRRDADGRFRDLHVGKAREVRLSGDLPCPWSRIDAPPSSEPLANLLDGDRFRIDRLLLGAGERRELSTRDAAGSTFRILFVWSGRLAFDDDVTGRREFGPHGCLLVPAALGDLVLEAVDGAATVVVMAPAR